MMRPAPPDPPEITETLWHGFRGGDGWDVGANCGQSLGVMTRRFNHTVAFEPAEECAPYLQHWADAEPYGQGTVTFVPIAISNRAGYIDLIELPDKIDTGQLVTMGITDMEWSTDTDAATVRKVPASTLDQESITYGIPDFIKVDVEGHEDRVLDGAKILLSMHHPDWLLEFHSRDLATACAAVFVSHGYRIEVVRHPHYVKDSTLWHQHGWIRAFFQ